MTIAEKSVLNEIVAELEKLSAALIRLEQASSVGLSSPRLVRKFDTLRSKIDALPSE